MSAHVLSNPGGVVTIGGALSRFLRDDDDCRESSWLKLPEDGCKTFWSPDSSTEKSFTSLFLESFFLDRETLPIEWSSEIGGILVSLSLDCEGVFIGVSRLGIFDGLLDRSSLLLERP